MGFSDTVKELLDQGLQASKEIASKAGEWGGRGLEVSKDFAAKAGARVQEAGEKGVLLLEIKQLEGQAKKLLGRLGAEVYGVLEKGAPSVGPEDAGIGATLKEIAAIRETVEKKEQELKNR